MLTILAFSIALVLDPDFEPVEPEISDAVMELAANRDSMSADDWIAQLDALGEAGDSSAWELIAELLAAGDSEIARDTDRACDYFERIGPNRGDALHSAAGCYWSGDGRPQDYVRARELYEQAIDAGYITSLCGLGTMLVRGQGGPVDVERGIANCELAAEFGDIDAMTDLGIFYLMGEGVAQNSVTAREWLQPAAEQGQANAAHLMGQIVMRGDGVAADNEEAARYFRIAYDAGRQDASWEIALALTRIGFHNDDEGMRIQVATMEEAQQWANEAGQTHPNPETRAEAAELARNIGVLLESAEGS